MPRERKVEGNVERERERERVESEDQDGKEADGTCNECNLKLAVSSFNALYFIFIQAKDEALRVEDAS